MWGQGAPRRRWSKLISWENIVNFCNSFFKLYHSRHFFSILISFPPFYPQAIQPSENSRSHFSENIWHPIVHLTTNQRLCRQKVNAHVDDLELAWLSLVNQNRNGACSANLVHMVQWCACRGRYNGVTFHHTDRSPAFIFQGYGQTIKMMTMKHFE